MTAFQPGLENNPPVIPEKTRLMPARWDIIDFRIGFSTDRLTPGRDEIIFLNKMNN